MKFSKLLVLVFMLFSFGTLLNGATNSSVKVRHSDVEDKNEKCITCHLKENRALVHQWESSAHQAANVGCYSCHASDKDDPLAYYHEGAYIRTIVTPKDCAFCHEKEAKEMGESHHATAGQIMASLDNMLAEVIASFPDTKADAVNGCWQCHGSIIKPAKDETGNLIYNEVGAPKMDWTTWPNSGIGRINHDGSRGTCNACHSKHTFAASISRQPENCGKCHLGPDHPQKEIYDESKHGIAFYSAPKGDVVGGMNIYKQGKWVLGKDYDVAPTCATCHMGAYRASNGSVVKGTHNVGDRISWILRPPVSKKLNRVTFEDGTTQDVTTANGANPPRVGDKAMFKDFIREGDKLKKVMKEKVIKSVITWKDRRKNMMGVCKNCHSTSKIENFYQQYDQLVDTYNRKFAIPGIKIVKELKKDGVLQNSGFNTKLGYIWFEIWHHEGRRARMGASMMAPDYTHWHGMYEVSQHFYNEFLPEVLKLAEEKGLKDKYEKMIDELIEKPEHKWYKTGGNPERMKIIEEERRARYSQ